MKKLIFGLILISIILFSANRYKKSFFKELYKKSKTEKKEKGPSDWMGMQRIYPYGKIRPEVYNAEMKKAANMHKQSSAKYQWELAGPTNIGGRITDIEVDPTDDNTVYVGAASGGIFKTTDAGNTWENIFADQPVISIGDIAIDPTDPNIIYAGTGEANSSSFSFIGNGVYKSTDGGNSWEHLGLEETAYIGRIIVDPTNHNRIFLAALGYLFMPNEERGVYRSLDGGQTWERKLFVTDSTSAIDLVMDPTDPNVLYAAMWEKMRGLEYRRSGGPTSGIYKSTDGGDTWTELTNGLPNSGTEGRIGLAIARSNPNVLYAIYDNAPFGGTESFLGVYRTTNSGESWEIISNTTNMNSIFSTFGWYFGQIRVDPTNENRVYCLGVELWKTENGGNSWEMVSDYGSMDEIHVDHHALAFTSTNKFYEGNDGGLYYSTDWGYNYTKINNLPINQFYQITIDNNHPEKLYGGLQDNGSVTTDDGSIDNWYEILSGDGFYCKVSPQNSNIYFAEYQWGNLYRFDPVSGTWGDYISPVNGDRTNWSTPYDLFATSTTVNSITIYLGTYRMYKSTNGGDSWQIVSDNLTRMPSSSNTDYYHTISTVAISPLNHNYVICGTDDGLVHISTNAGNSWDNITSNLPNRWITKAIFDPIEENTVYVTLSGFRWNESLPHVFKSTTLGQYWTDISSNLPEIPTNCIVIDPLDNQRIFVGTDSGVFMTNNGGNSWESASNGMPNAPITDLKIHNQTRTLVVATYGCSAYKINLDTGFVASDTNELPQSKIAITKCYPNPFIAKNSKTSSVEMEFSLPRSGFVTADVYNMKGQKVKSLAKRYFEKGKNNIYWDTKDKFSNPVSSGVYFVSLRLNNSVPIVKKITIIK